MIYSVPMRLFFSLFTAMLFVSALSAEAEQKLQWHSLSRGMELAKQQHRMIYVQVVTEWCGYCRKLQTEDYKKSAVRELLSRYVLVSIDGDHQADVANRFNVQGYPTLLVLSPSGDLLVRMDGYPGAHRLKQVLSSTLEKNKMAEATSGKDERTTAPEAPEATRTSVAGAGEEHAVEKDSGGTDSEASRSSLHPLNRAQEAMQSGQYRNSVRILDAFIASSEYQNSELALARFYRGMSLFELGDDRAREDLHYASRRAPLPEQREKARNLLESIQE